MYLRSSTKWNGAQAQNGKKGAAHAQPPRSMINYTRGKTKKAVNHANGKIRRDWISYIRMGVVTLPKELNIFVYYTDVLFNFQDVYPFLNEQFKELPELTTYI